MWGKIDVSIDELVVRLEKLRFSIYLKFSDRERERSLNTIALGFDGAVVLLFQGTWSNLFQED